MLFTLALIAFLEFTYYSDYILIALQSNAHRGTALLGASTNGILVFMLVWSLLATFFSNPGYLASYIISKRVNVSNSSIYNIYIKSKGAYAVAADEESPLLQPYLTVTVNENMH